MSAPAKAPLKRLTIKPLKRKVELPEDFFVTTWTTLKGFVHAVHALQPASHSYEQLYGSVTDLVIAKRGADLYEAVVAEMDAHVATTLDAEVARSQTQDAAAQLASAAAAWSTHCSQVLLIRNVFLYLDRTYVRETAGVQPLWEAGVALFRRQLLARRALLDRTVRSFTALVAADRGGALVDRATLAATSRALGALALYASDLEPAVLRETAAYFEAESAARLAATDPAQYLRLAESRLDEERERARAFLDPGTTWPLLALVEARLLGGAAAGALVERGFAPLMDAGRRDDLRRMYALLSLVRRTDDVRRAFAEYAKARAGRIVAGGDEERDRVMVPALLEFRDAMEAALAQSFRGDDAFASALKSAVEFGVNSRENKPAELIAKFIDARMRGGARAGSAGGGRGAAASGAIISSDGADGGAPSAAAAGGVAGGGGGGGGTAEEELEAVMDKTMALFRGIHGKDVFEAFYKKDLAKRLLLGKSSSTDAEKALVSRLKSECGAAFTAKLEGMFKDVDGSAELSSQFAEARRVAADAAARAGGGGAALPPTLPLDLHVHVLTSSYWPTYARMPGVIVPPELAPAQAEFERFYGSKFSKGRGLHWQHSLGHCVLRAAFPHGRKELDVSTFQTLVLLLFNGGDALPFAAIKERTGVEDGELRRTLQSLACGAVRVLRKEPKGRDVGDGDVFHFNADFRAALVRIKINSIQMKETKEEADATNERVVEDRQYQIDAAVVRIMKTRKRLSHNALMAELFPMLRFAAKAPDIKKRLESLIERDYLERDAADSSMYTYLA